jgi:GT2 family glycosyltransferase
VPSVSALVCTRNRPESLAATLRALLEGSDDSVEIVVVDQSDGSESERIVAALGAGERIVHRRSTQRGKGLALNQGLELARGEILVCTDDDCLPPPGWPQAMAAILRGDPDAVIAFCRVDPVPYDRTQGYVPAYELEQARSLTSLAGLRNGVGLGAAMAVRRDFVTDMGGFDECFGPGGRFPSADEWDLVIRALIRGKHVLETPSLTVVHDGFRTFAQGAEHARRDWFALGAVCAKPLRAGHLSAVLVAATVFSSRALWPPIADVLHLRRPRGLGRVTAFARGFAAGMQTPVEAKTLRFARR